MKYALRSITSVSTLMLAVIAAGCAASGARADDANTDANRPAVEDEIIVTGQPYRPASILARTETGSRLGVSSFDTPASISVLGGDEIRLRGDINIQDAVTRAAGITSQAQVGNGNTGLAARGFASVNSVQVLYDGQAIAIGGGTVSFPYDPWTVGRQGHRWALGGCGSNAPMCVVGDENRNQWSLEVIEKTEDRPLGSAPLQFPGSGNRAASFDRQRPPTHIVTVIVVEVDAAFCFSGDGIDAVKLKSLKPAAAVYLVADLDLAPVPLKVGLRGKFARFEVGSRDAHLPACLIVVDGCL